MQQGEYNHNNRNEKFKKKPHKKGGKRRSNNRNHDNGDDRHPNVNGGDGDYYMLNNNNNGMDAPSMSSYSQKKRKGGKGGGHNNMPYNNEKMQDHNQFPLPGGKAENEDRSQHSRNRRGNNRNRDYGGNGGRGGGDNRSDFRQSQHGGGGGMPPINDPNFIKNNNDKYHQHQGPPQHYKGGDRRGGGGNHYNNPNPNMYPPQQQQQQQQGMHPDSHQINSRDMMRQSQGNFNPLANEMYEPRGDYPEPKKSKKSKKSKKKTDGNSRNYDNQSNHHHNNFNHRNNRGGGVAGGGDSNYNKRSNNHHNNRRNNNQNGGHNNNNHNHNNQQEMHPSNNHNSNNNQGHNSNHHLNKHPKHFNSKENVHSFVDFQWKINSSFFDKKDDSMFESYHTFEECKTLISEKKAFRGDIQFKDNTPFLGTVKSDDFVKKIYIKNYDINRAMHGSDIIFVPISPNWEKYLTSSDPNVDITTIQKEEREESQEEYSVNLDAPETEKETQGVSTKIFAKVIFIENNPISTRNIVVKVKKDYIYSSLGCYIYDGRYPFFTLNKEDYSKFTDQLYNYYFLARYDKWHAEERYPSIRLLQPIGEVGNLKIECECLIKQYNIPARPYPDQEVDYIRNELNLDENNELKITLEIEKNREDLRPRFIASVDPETAKDLDDALSIELIEEGVYEVGVHIADVSHFVKQGGYIDSEACKRSISYYFPDRVFPMLPQILCDNLCSLNPGKDRLAFSIFFRMNDKGERILDFKPRLTKTIINSSCKLSYQAAKDIINDKTTTIEELGPKYPIYNDFKFEDLASNIKMLNYVAQKRREGRLDDGSIVFRNHEKKKFNFNKDQSKILSWEWEQKTEANNMVEEYMLLANILVAEILYEKVPNLAVLRRHGDPNLSTLNNIQNIFKQVGNIELDMSSNQQISRSLERIDKIEEIPSVKRNFLHFSMMKLLKRAEYFVACEQSPDSFKHFALNFPIYTHFTSPIRRYADLLVHRMLTYILAGQKPQDHYKELDLIHATRTANQNKKNGKTASKKADLIYYLLLLRTEPKRTKAVVMEVDFNKITIFIEEIFDVKIIMLKNYDREMLGDGKVHIKGKLRKDKKKRKPEYDEVLDVVVEKYQLLNISIKGTNQYPVELQIDPHFQLLRDKEERGMDQRPWDPPLIQKPIQFNFKKPVQIKSAHNYINELRQQANLRDEATQRYQF